MSAIKHKKPLPISQKKRKDGTLSHAVVFDPKKDPTRTKQSEAARCDIRNILKSYRASGMQYPTLRPEQFMDNTGRPTFQEAMNVVTSAQSRFQELPAHIRDRFRNSPEAFMAFMEDARNLDEAIALGLVTKRNQEAPGASGEELEEPLAPKKTPKAPKGDVGGQPKGGSADQ